RAEPPRGRAVGLWCGGAGRADAGPRPPAAPPALEDRRSDRPTVRRFTRSAPTRTARTRGNPTVASARRRSRDTAPSGGVGTVRTRAWATRAALAWGARPWSVQ